jgi:hypothetical protein
MYSGGGTCSGSKVGGGDLIWTRWMLTQISVYFLDMIDKGYGMKIVKSDPNLT